MESITFLNDVAYDALPFALVCLGFVLTSKYLRMPDVTASGSFVLGAAVAAVLIVKLGWPPLPAVAAAMLAGGLAGALTAWFVKILGIEKLLAGILASFALYAVNVMLLTPTVAYGDSPTLLSRLELKDRLIVAGGGSWHPWVIGGFLLVVIGVKGALDWLLASQTGLVLRAMEDEEAGESTIERHGFSPRLVTFTALCAGNAIVALAGALISFKEGAANAFRGFDVLITGLVALLLGQQIAKVLMFLVPDRLRVRYQLKPTSAAVIGAICFFALMTAARRLGISSEWTQIILVCCVAVAAARHQGGFRHWLEPRGKPAPDTEMALLSTQHLSFRYPAADIDALADLNLTVEDGEVVELRGANGSGKTTALRLIGGLLEGGTGTIQTRETDLTGRRRERLKAFVYVDQHAQRSVVGSLTAEENLALASFNGHASPLKRAVSHQIRQRIDRILRQSGFRVDLGRTLSRSLSGGQRQVLSLLTLLAREVPPKLILLDEPTNHLDKHNTERAGAILARLHASGAAIVLVSHCAVPGLEPDRVFDLHAVTSGVIESTPMEVNVNG
jgi:putative ABC transport system permease protein